MLHFSTYCKRTLDAVGHPGICWHTAFTNTFYILTQKQSVPGILNRVVVKRIEMQ